MSDIQFITRVGKNQTSGLPRGQKRPFRPREVWAIRARLEMLGEIRNLALLNLAIDSKLRGCDLVRLKVSDVFHLFASVYVIYFENTICILIINIGKKIVNKYLNFLFLDIFKK